MQLQQRQKPHRCRTNEKLDRKHTAVGPMKTRQNPHRCRTDENSTETTPLSDRWRQKRQKPHRCRTDGRVWPQLRTQNIESNQQSLWLGIPSSGSWLLASEATSTTAVGKHRGPCAPVDYSKYIQFGWGTQYPHQQLGQNHVSCDRNHTAVAPMELCCFPLLYRDPNGKHQKRQPLQLITVHEF